MSALAANDSNSLGDLPASLTWDVRRPIERNATNLRSLDLEKLEALGLTGRQSEIAFWLSQGKTNDELPIIVGVSYRTVAHLIEAILTRLRLSTRAEIMLRTLEALGWPRWPTRETDHPGKRLNGKRLRVPRRTTLGKCAYIQQSARSHNPQNIAETPGEK
jgi:DNA-binding CsgD family transcriptional regulator